MPIIATRCLWLTLEQVCSPSRSDTARKLTESYQKGDFAKRAMLRYCFKDTNVAGDMERCSTILL